MRLPSGGRARDAVRELWTVTSQTLICSSDTACICKIKNRETKEVKYVSGIRYDQRGRAVFILTDSSVLLNKDAALFEIVQ